MKIKILIICLLLIVCTAHAQTNSITDPIQDYYQHEMATDDNSNIMYVFKGNYTEKEHQCVFITDDQSAEQKGLYSWTVYYPKPNAPNQYLKITTGLDFSLGGPSYIGYIQEISGYGLVYASKSTVGVQFIKNGENKRVFFTKDGTLSESGSGDSYPETFPKYFGASNKVEITKYTLSKLTQMYP